MTSVHPAGTNKSSFQLHSAAAAPETCLLLKIRSRVDHAIRQLRFASGGGGMVVVVVTVVIVAIVVMVW